MATQYRIPVTVKPGEVVWINDLDLALLLAHAGPSVSDPLDIQAWCPDSGYHIPLQYLSSAAPSAIRGKRCRTLVLGPGQDALIALVVTIQGAGNDVASANGKAADEVKIKETPDALEITVSDKPFVTYRYNTKDPETPRPYFHPVIGPTGKTITQMGEVAGKKEKHFHHTALWIAHQNFTAKGEPTCDNWQIGKPRSRMEHVKFDKIESGPLAARFIEQLRWLNVKGDKALLTEARTVTIPKRPATSRVLDIDIVLTAQDLPVTLNKTPYHILAARVLDAMLPARGGAITNSDGKKNPGDGTSAKWIDISGKLDGDEQGIALFNHPDNLRQPTPCLQFAGQTIGLSPTHKEAYTIEPGKQLRLRYRVLVHAGNVTDGKVAAEYEAYEKPGQSRIGGPERVTG